MNKIASIILDYKSQVPKNTVEGAPIIIPQTPLQAVLASFTVNLPAITPSAADNRVFLFADAGVQSLGPLFNNGLIFRIYRDGAEIFNTSVGVQIPGPAGSFYDFAFNTIDESVPFGAHLYQLTVQAAIQSAQSTAQVIGPITFSALALGTS